MGGWSDALEAPPGEAFKAEQASDGFTLEPVARFSSFFIFHVGIFSNSS